MEERASGLNRGDGKEEEGAKFRDYFDHHEPLPRCLLTARWRCSVVVTKAYLAFAECRSAVRRAAERELLREIIMDHLGLRLNNAPADSWRKVW